MKQFLIIAGLLLIGGFSSGLQAQTKEKYFVYFRDKNNTPYSIANPKAFLSEAALARRAKQNIRITSRDLPVNPAYVTQLKNAGIEVFYKSKWFNGAVIFCDANQLAQVSTLPFIKNTTALNRVKPGTGPEKFPDNPVSNLRTSAQRSQYGIAYNQAEMIGATRLHDKGFRGEGKTIAVFDAGFPGVDKDVPFQHLYQNNQIKGTYNFVNNDPNVYIESSHGTATLSCIGAYEPGKFIGTAYKANFFLFTTEYASSEHRAEEFNWLLAAEYSDSAGVDVISSSLGYTTFDLPSTSYTPADMNGNKTVVTKAADMAAATGMLVINSAGNEGADIWRIIGAPADGDSVLAVGAVDSLGNKANFSSFGPTADGRIKPNVSAQGQLAAIIVPGGYATRSNGTSFSCPILAGMATAFWQANPNLTNMQVIRYLELSATQANNPDDRLGYGIPNYEKAKALIAHDLGAGNTINAFPVPLAKNQNISLDFKNDFFEGSVQVRVFDRVGRLVEDQRVQKKAREDVSVRFKSDLTAGMYIMQVMWADQIRTQRVIKLQ